MPNRLAAETSPYLLQHADNPVDWYPWGDAAFEAARASDRPVLLSIGYSACHWCHVMAHESFEDESVAEVMNRLFVNVKVDREERPDIDRIYQLAHQILTQRGGGWPLTMFLDPSSQRPFFGGTYFPKEARHGLPAFPDLLKSVASYYTDKRGEIGELAGRIDDVFAQLDPAPVDAGVELGPGPLGKLRKHLANSFDREYGGFGSAPKFPHPTTIDRLLRHWRATASSDEPDLEALLMATLTLTRMAEGGIHDHVGGGFCRYSVDRYWAIPHFEKMLYDNGPLLALYADAYAATGDEWYGEVANGIADWMQADLGAPEGGFYASLDADSEGEEGRYYVWTPDEVRELLPDDAFPLFARHFGLDQPPNFEGHWHLVIRETLADAAEAENLSLEEAGKRIGESKAILLEARRKRVPPGRDDKQLTSWNALAIRGLAIAGRRLGRPELVDAAARAHDFIIEKLFEGGRLFASYKDGGARFPAYLDDHAFLIDATLELLQSRWDGSRLDFVTELAGLLLAHFEDGGNGGFYFTADDAETLMHRPKPLADEAMPSGNGIAAYALQRLGFLLGETKFLDAAERSLRAGWRAMSEYPHGHVSLLTALEEYRRHPEIIVIRGAASEIERWRATAASLYAPRRLVFAIPADAGDLPGALAERRPEGDEPVAYRCVGTHCDLPITRLEALTELLRETPP